MASTTVRLSLLAGLALGAGAGFASGRFLPPAAAQEGTGAGKKREAAEEVKGTEYHFGTSPARTTILFESETDLETIHGVVRAMGGSARFDWEEAVGAARLTVPVKEMKTGIDTRDEHLRTADWLDEARHPEIIFEASRIERKGKEGNTWVYEGFLTVHGVRRPLKGEAAVTRIPEELGKKLGRGEWVKVKTDFPVTLADFGIVIPDGPAQGKVNPTWQVKIDVFGTTARPER